MNRLPLVSGILLMSAGGISVAAATDFTDTAEVISAAPIYDRISEPRKECWLETVDDVYYEPRQERRSLAGPIIGGVAGALLGSQIGGGSGAKVATGAGAIVGAITGDRISQRGSGRAYETRGTREVERCRTKTSYREVVTGYDVVYRYNGHEGRTRLPYDPGDTIKVGVSVGVVEGGRSHLSRRH
ncbi:MAG: glycine zipper 2TM domain-containing protein [Burkholderiales bacterium]|nr:glycine zipper 2TM domain-containing protein [Pseudomonadota bacterium]